MSLWLGLISLASIPVQAQIVCQEMPAAAEHVNRDVKSDVRAAAAAIGPVKAGEVGIKTEIVGNNLFAKYPNADRLLVAQMMAATYCSMLKSSGISPTEQQDRWMAFSDKVFLFVDPNYKPPSSAKQSSVGKEAVPPKAREEVPRQNAPTTPSTPKKKEGTSPSGPRWSENGHEAGTPAIGRVSADRVGNETRKVDAITWAWPASGQILAWAPTHHGIDIRGAAGSPVLAAADGTVLYAGNGIRGYGNLVILGHRLPGSLESIVSAYANNMKNLVKEDMKVKRGDRIAEMGSGASGLHFDVRVKGQSVDPINYLPPIN